ncbi:CARDB domain-containing protein [Paenibacillus polymyxa]|uniref:CARDB domain-containing protein n=1 Tax=Paenibacillus polymyxa TaxID=1406 RepID=UPI000589F9C5|nr:CARDB domain-containing protein [Paenibacillus polymyxa]AJE54208.1 hypothetical protein RE92_24760 [Paenibacillus polymyxa]
MKGFLAFVMVFILLGAGIASAADEEPMLKKYTGYEYGNQGLDLNGYVPALNKRVVRPWELVRWTGIFKFDGGKSTKITNYDVFNVKRKPDDPNFDKENGFGLVHKSQPALGELFDKIIITESISTKQKKYFRDTFTKSADDPAFADGNEFYYYILRKKYLRTSGIVQRMGIKFTSTKKISESNRQALYEVTKWPELKATASAGNLNVDMKTFGVSERDVRIVATKKGAFPDFKNAISLNEGKLIHTSAATQSKTLKLKYQELADQLGEDIDIVVDDGYGRTAIKSVHLPKMPKEMDYIPTKLTLTEGNQLWLKWKYVGEDFKAGDYIDGRGIPNIAHVTVKGPESGKQKLEQMYNSGIPATVKSGQEFSHYLGKVYVGRTPGTYKISIDAFANNPSHPSRATEVPDEAYRNNEIKAEYTVKLVPIDLVAQSITATPSQIGKNSKATIVAKVKNISEEDQKQVMIRITADDDTILEVRKDMPANKPVTVGPIDWTGREVGLHNMTVQVDPVNEIPDVNPGNNIASTACTVVGSNSGTSGCNSSSDHSTAKTNWTIPYRYIYEIEEVNRPLWKTAWVDYSEHLNVSTQINTKQGIATDPEHPKESDRESRGSWAIIPYAKQNNLNPNEVTRAGYGYELKVTTNYQTDWEKKVPRGFNETARPIGGTYIGPTPGEAIAKFYDRNGNFLNSITLERTSGGNTGTAVWELPKREGTFLDGTKVLERKVYTDKDWADGDVLVKVYVTAEGSKGKLVACTTSKIRIYGSMFEDTQNVRTRN